jgi:hypothetical protein
MNNQRDVELINELLAHASELTWLEFKKNNAQKAGLIKPANPEHPRAGYVPFWA